MRRNQKLSMFFCGLVILSTILGLATFNYKNGKYVYKHTASSVVLANSNSKYDFNLISYNTNEKDVRENVMPWQRAYEKQIYDFIAEHSPKNVYIYLYDMDNNGIPELFIGAAASYKIYTYNNDIIFLDEIPLDSSELYIFDTPNSIFIYGRSGTMYSIGIVCTMADGKLTRNGDFGEEMSGFEILCFMHNENPSYFHNDIKISSNEYSYLIDKYTSPSKKIESYYISDTVAMDEFIKEQLYSSKYTSILSDKSTFTALPSKSEVMVNGRSIDFEIYNINNSNYFKLRDIAYILNGTSKQFEIGYNTATKTITLTSDKPYNAVGGEMSLSVDNFVKIAIPTESKLFLDGKELNLTAYVIDGNTFFKLRDLGEILDFVITYNEDTKSIGIGAPILGGQEQLLSSDTYEEKTVSTFRGTLSKEVWHHDGLNMSVDSYILTLDTPANFKLYNPFTDEIDIITDCQEVNIFYNGDVELEKYLDKYIEIKGAPFMGHTIHHRRLVVIPDIDIRVFYET